jgi:hypothetical protein
MKKFNKAALNTASGPGKGGMFRAAAPAAGAGMRRMQKGGMAASDMEGEMMDRMGRGMAKAEMQEKAMQAGGIAKAIKKHEQSSAAHKAGLKSGGVAKKSGVTRADGVIKKAHTKGTMIKMANGGKVSK